jgi:formate dehydrogenase iron-sulfur subunit
MKELRKQAADRVSHLHQQGESGAYLYGADDKILGGLNAFYLLVDKPEVYGLPSAPKLPSRSVPLSAFWGIFAALLTGLGALFAFRDRTRDKPAPGTAPTPPREPESPTHEVAPLTRSLSPARREVKP